jgi:hypothetical protein
MNFMELAIKLAPYVSNLETLVALVKKYASDPRTAQAIELLKELENDPQVKDAIGLIEQLVPILTAPAEQPNSPGLQSGGATG